MIKKLSILIISVLVLVGCSSPQDKGGALNDTITICTSTDATTGYQSMKQTFTSVGDLVSVLEFEGQMDVGSLENVELISEAMDEVISQTKDIKGLTVDYEIVNDTVIKDYTKVVVEGGDLDAIQEFGLLQLTEDAKLISLEQSVKGLTDVGYTCSTK